MFAKIIISGVLGISGEATFLHSCKPFPIFLSLRSRSCLDQSLALAAHSKAQESSPPRCGLTSSGVPCTSHLSHTPFSTW